MQQRKLTTVPSISVAFMGRRRVGFIEEAALSPSPREVLIRTLYSGISAGTELSAYRGSNPYLNKHWDVDRRLFVEDPSHETLRYPLVGWGYEEVGEIVERGTEIEDLPHGTTVFGTWGHRSRTLMAAEEARQRCLPQGVDPTSGIFSQIGAIALNGVLDAAIRPGDVVAVFGLGVVGNLAAQIASRAGARVIGVDLLPRRREIAASVAVETLDALGRPAGEAIKDLTRGRGADVCIEASGSTRALNEAIRGCAYSSRVIALGFYQGEAAGLFLGEEFHHNRISIISSQIGGVAPDLQHRWDRHRLVREFMQMAVNGTVQLQPLITHIVPAWEAPSLFELLDTQPGEVLQAALDFREPFPSHIAVLPLEGS